MKHTKYKNHHLNNLGKTLIIVNPVAQSGMGSKSGKIAFNMLRDEYKQHVELIYTKAKDDAIDIAAKANDYDTVVAIGGDGVIHETVNGLMQIDRENRPTLGIIPVGSGNDFAKSLGVSLDTQKAVHQLMSAKKRNIDIGQVNDKYFDETLSFGLDAGIAIGTMELRKKTKSKGFILYFKSGVDQILHHFHFYDFKLTIDDKEIEDNCLMMAFQNGITYGGGFQICPEASMEDGKIDICYASGGYKVPKALFVFALASKGKHANFKQVSFFKSQTAKLKFSGEHIPKCQIDGEEYHADEYNIKMLPKQLDVYSWK